MLDKTKQAYIWVSVSNHPERKGQLCTIEAGGMGNASVRVLFEDGGIVHGPRTNVRIYSVANAKRYIRPKTGETRICQRCKKEKDLSEFYKNKSVSDGYSNRCNKCNTINK